MEKATKENLLNNFYEKCRHAGLNVTPQRLAIYKSLIGDKSHPSPEKIYKRVKSEFPMISFATVYKTLETFEQKGIIAKVTTLHNTLRYDPFPTRHHHIVCVKCKKIIDIDSDELNSLPIPPQVKEGNVFLDYSIHFNVICADCRGKK